MSAVHPNGSKQQPERINSNLLTDCVLQTAQCIYSELHKSFLRLPIAYLLPGRGNLQLDRLKLYQDGYPRLLNSGFGSLSYRGKAIFDIRGSIGNSELKFRAERLSNDGPLHRGQDRYGEL